MWLCGFTNHRLFLFCKLMLNAEKKQQLPCFYWLFQSLDLIVDMFVSAPVELVDYCICPCPSVLHLMFNSCVILNMEIYITLVKLLTGGATKASNDFLQVWLHLITPSSFSIRQKPCWATTSPTLASTGIMCPRCYRCTWEPIVPTQILPLWPLAWRRRLSRHTHLLRRHQFWAF